MDWGGGDALQPPFLHPNLKGKFGGAAWALLSLPVFSSVTWKIMASVLPVMGWGSNEVRK